MSDFLINAMMLIPENCCAVILVGDGLERLRLEKLVEELKLTLQVFFAGKKPQTEITKWMSAADALVIASGNEGGPTISIKTLACGLQVVDKSVGIIPEVIDSEDIGFVVPPEDPAVLASALSKAAQRKVDREKLRARAEMFFWERLSERVLQVDQSVTGEQRA